ncbi:MAG: pyrroline-5-carboxylate reductase, partial [Hyphomicrobiales bacterium]
MAETSNTDALARIDGTILLAGAGKMGGAMLNGWLNAGVPLSRITVIEPYLS